MDRAKLDEAIDAYLTRMGLTRESRCTTPLCGHVITSHLGYEGDDPAEFGNRPCFECLFCDGFGPFVRT